MGEIKIISLMIRNGEIVKLSLFWSTLKGDGLVEINHLEVQCWIRIGSGWFKEE